MVGTELQFNKIIVHDVSNSSEQYLTVSNVSLLVLC